MVLLYHNPFFHNGVEFWSEFKPHTNLQVVISCRSWLVCKGEMHVTQCRLPGPLKILKISVVRKCVAGLTRLYVSFWRARWNIPRPLKCHLAPLIRKLSWCATQRPRIFPICLKFRLWSSLKLSQFICLTLPAYFAAGTYCAGVFIIFTPLVMSCFGLLPDFLFKPLPESYW